METKSPTRTQRRAAELRERIIDIAEELLINEGEAAVSSEEIAQRADVAVQTVYNRVGGKPALLSAIAERAMAVNREYIDIAYDQQGTAEERSWRIFQAYLQFATSHPRQFRILRNPPAIPEVTARLAAQAEEQNAKLADIVRAGIQEGTASEALNPVAAANAMWAMMDGLLDLALREDGLRPEGLSPEQLIQTGVLIAQFGLRKR